MAQYVKATNFASKDALLTGDPNKIVKGAEIDDEFNNIQTGINSKADTLSPTLTGTPLAPTAPAGTNTTQIATTSFVGTAVTNGVANGKVSPVFTGTPTAPTAAVGNNTTQLATTAFVNAEIANDITAPLALKAPLASPALTGTPTAPTPSAGTNTTQVATTAFVTTAVNNFVVQTGDIADSAVTNAKIANDAITTAKIAPTGVSANTYGSATAIPVVTVNAEGQVTSATTAAITISDPIGVNQTWQNPSRSLGTTYTNSTGRPIQVTASVKNTASAVVGGVTIFNSTTVSCCGVPQISFFPLSFIVPNNTTYVINGAGLNVWAELR